jgi:transposase
MRKRIYQAISVKHVDVDRLVGMLQDRAIFGCDAAKDCWYGALMNKDGDVVLTIYWDIQDDREEFLGLLEKIRQANVTVEVVAEPTGTYASALMWELEQAGFPIFRVSPKHTHDYSEVYDGVPSTHDAKAAAVVADLHRIRGKKASRWRHLSKARRKLRAAAAETDWLKGDVGRYHNRIESRLALHWPELGRILDLSSATATALLETFGGPTGVVKAPQKAQCLMKKVSRGKLAEEKIDAVITSARETQGMPMVDDERHQLRALGTRVAVLRCDLKVAERRLERLAKAEESTHGISQTVGVNTAAILVAYLGDFREYSSVKALIRSAGLNLKIRSSGKKKGQLKITKRGPSAVRRWLFMAVLRWIQKDIIAKAWYQRKIARNGGNKMKAVVALMRKLLAGLYHVARGERFDSTKLFDTSRLKLAA